MECEVRETEAKYWVDGNLYATCDYPLGRIPIKGYFGFARYNLGEEKFIRDVKITYLQDYARRKEGKEARKNNVEVEE
jgi:hypothetical protein